MLPEYIFIDRGDQLRKLIAICLYPAAGIDFGNESEILKNRLGGELTRSLPRYQ